MFMCMFCQKGNKEKMDYRATLVNGGSIVKDKDQ